VTLTAQTADVPLVVENALSRPVRVRMIVASDKLEFPGGGTRTVDLAPGVNHLEIPVRTRATGAFPLAVDLQTPDGSVTLADANMRIRSTAISGIGLVLSIGAGFFLVLWWARHWRDARRSRRLVSPSHPAVGAFADPRAAARKLLTDDPPADPR
jgi:hypothetical protein